MVHCPKCGSPIGNDLPGCPICHQPFSAEEKKAMFAEQAADDRKLRAAQQLAIDAFRRKRDIFTAAVLAMLVLYPAAVFAVSKLTKSSTATVIAAVAGLLVWVGVIVGGFVSGAVICPHCGEILYHQQGPYCQHCGGKLR